MADAIYAIDEFPNDDFLWCIVWISGVGYNASAPSDPLIDVRRVAQLTCGTLDSQREFSRVSASLNLMNAWRLTPMRFASRSIA